MIIVLGSGIEVGIYFWSSTFLFCTAMTTMFSFGLSCGCACGHVALKKLCIEMHGLQWAE